jgi:putative ABC transport system permease protein
MGGICAALGIGAVAGLLPAVRAARLSPTEALRTV